MLLKEFIRVQGLRHKPWHDQDSSIPRFIDSHLYLHQIGPKTASSLSRGASKEKLPRFPIIVENISSNRFLPTLFQQLVHSLKHNPHSIDLRFGHTRSDIPHRLLAQSRFPSKTSRGD
jgi:hypothetical protein